MPDLPRLRFGAIIACGALAGAGAAACTGSHAQGGGGADYRLFSFKKDGTPDTPPPLRP